MESIPVIGQTFCHYQIVERIGAGGMGEVYRARDTKLGRDVALKVLPEAFARNAERMARFRREAQVLASLNHPNIATIYGLEESNGSCTLVMELVEGPTLAERIRGSAEAGAAREMPIHLDESLHIAKQIAEGLEYAHERGIIHRDLKPANVKVRPDGTVKILDFGLAKALAAEASGTDLANSPTISAAASREGMILGTAAYMSPEQARGKTVDRRCDIWSFGAVLFEMLSGKQVFAGEDVSHTLAAVIMKEPDRRPSRSSSLAGCCSLPSTAAMESPATLCTLGPFAGGSWADDDTIYFVGAMPGGVMRVPASGGQAKEVAKIDFANGERMHKYPCALPGSQAVLFTVSTAETETFDDARIVGLNIETGQRGTLVEGGTYPLYSPSGHLVYARGGNLVAVRFDAKRLKVTGQPFTVLEGVLMSVNSGVANYDISASGDLVYVPGTADRGARTLVWVDREGKAEPLPLPPRSYLHPRFSPDMRQLAIEIEGPNHDFYLYDFARGVLSKMTTDGVSHWPVWSPDGTQLVYRSGLMMRWRMWRIPADRSHSPEQLPGTGISQNAESWSPDGNSIAYTAVTPELGSHIMVESLEGNHQSRPFVDTKAPAGSPKFSPDGHWLAYCSNESGKAQVYVQAFPGPGAKIQVSNDGGTDPVWRRTGGELYFRNGDKMMAVAVSTAPTFTAGRPRMLWEGRYSHGMSTSCGPPGATSSNYDVTADGRRFLMIKDEAPDSAVSKQIVVVLSWADEVTRIEKTKTSQT